MNLHQLRRNEALLEKLASEYVLGTLRGGARRRFEGWIAQDAVVRQTVGRWQNRLHPLAEFAPAVQPPAAVWKALEKELGLTGAKRRGWLQTVRDNLGFWRGLSLASTTATAVLLGVLLLRGIGTDTGAASYVATLSDERAQAVALVTGYPSRGELTVRILAPQAVAADRDLELWAVPASGAPRSLGLVARDGSITLPLPEDANPDHAALLAVSLEPRGGSPGAGPSGPILFKGAWLRVQG